MSDLRTAAQQALESIDWLRHHLIQHHGCLHMNPTASGIPAWLNKNEAALRAALAEPVQEPVAWMYDFLNPDSREEAIRNRVTQNPVEIEREKGFNVRPLYTTPPQRKPLTEEKIRNAINTFKAAENLMGVNHIHVARAIERAHGIGDRT